MAAACAAVGALLISLGAHGQGSLSPPAGPPAPGMKTLEQTEPRTPISAVPIVIDQPGSYYFTGPLELGNSGVDAILITASNVTLDLMGFTLSSLAPITGSRGIVIESSASNVTVRNGTIAGHTVVTDSGPVGSRTWTATLGGFDQGVEANFGSDLVALERIVVVGVRGIGIRLNGSGNSLAYCTVASSGGNGFSVGSGHLLACSANRNFGSGFSLGFVTAERLAGMRNRLNGVTGAAVALSGGHFDLNGGMGVWLDNSSLANVSSRRNNQTGFEASDSVLTNCVAFDNGEVGFRGNRTNLTNCSAHNNQTGFAISNGQLANCVARNNGTWGFTGSNNVVAFCRAVSNGTGNSNVTGTLSGNLF